VKPRIKIEFYITGEKINPDEISRILGILPSYTRIKGDYNPNKSIQYQASLWSIETEYYESYDIREQINMIMEVLKNKIEILNKIKHEFQAEFRFVIVVEIPKSGGPIISFDIPFIQFASEIGSEIGIDYYF
jgi:hypothetical protein